MHEPSAEAIVSPDGRYVVTVEQTADRFEMLYDTLLAERLTGERIFVCKGAPRAEFAADGTLAVHYPGYEPGGVQIDPARAVFRTHPSEPWVPLGAWPVVEAAFGRGWAQGIEFRDRGGAPVFPWAEVALLLGSAAGLLLLALWPLLMGGAHVVLLIAACAGVMFFGWLAAGGVRHWARERKWRRGSGRSVRSWHPR